MSAVEDFLREFPDSNAKGVFEIVRAVAQREKKGLKGKLDAISFPKTGRLALRPWNLPEARLDATLRRGLKLLNQWQAEAPWCGCQGTPDEHTPHCEWDEARGRVGLLIKYLGEQADRLLEQFEGERTRGGPPDDAARFLEKLIEEHLLTDQGPLVQRRWIARLAPELLGRELTFQQQGQRRRSRSAKRRARKPHPTA